MWVQALQPEGRFLVTGSKKGGLWRWDLPDFPTAVKSPRGKKRALPIASLELQKQASLFILVAVQHATGTFSGDR